VADGLVTASYATDPALLAELRAAWPPGRSPLHAAADDGYRTDDLADRLPDAAIRLAERYAVAFVADGDGWLAVILAGFGGRWWRAAAGDGASAFVAGVPAASERRITADQTNDSIVVGERAIVKWLRRIGARPSRSAILLAHLAAHGYRGVPKPLGTVSWRGSDGTDLPIAAGAAFLPDARDGWEWAVERLESGRPDAVETGHELGGLVAGLHRALGTPSEVIPGPFAVTAAGEVAGWRAAALATLDAAVELTDGADGEELRAWKPAMRTAVTAPAADAVVTLQPVHGDLHVGQVLEWPGGFAVIDFDGNPTLGDAANALRQPIERDVAQMLTSLDHVGRIVERRRGLTGDASIAAWIAAARAAFLAAYGPIDLDRLAAFEIEQECRELVYAARFLPRWRYAPMAALRARFGRSARGLPD